MNEQIDFALEICNLSRITKFALKLHINSQPLSQSESSNFSQCVILDVILIVLIPKGSPCRNLAVTDKFLSDTLRG